ncbi:hypothetical protein G6F32_016655 [Rhizopus arrhizus]|nr:hypothetical protein G6F32_016655 [Rhizopus arrhizus]
MARNSARIGGVSPTSCGGWSLGVSAAGVGDAMAGATAGSTRCASATASSRSNGLDRNSCAPPRNAPAVLATSV